MMETKEPLRNGTPERVLQLQVDLTSIPAAQRRSAVERVARRIAEQPGVITALPRPVWAGSATLDVRADDRRPGASAADPATVGMQMVSPGYFDLIGVPLLRGDDLAPAADTNARVIIGSDLARRLWGDADPIGRRLTQISPAHRVRRDIVVSGVYDSRYMDKFGQAVVYRPVRNLWSDSYLIRTAVPASELAVSIRGIVRADRAAFMLRRLGERRIRRGGAIACA